MSSIALVPADDGDDLALTPSQRGRAGRARRRAELEIFCHGLATAVRVECEIQDAQAVADVIRTSLEEEMGLLDWGLHRANGSAAKTELVARKVEMLSNFNNRRISRRFGR